MYILIDLEWISENKSDTVTQLAACRISETWKAAEEFCRLVRPADMERFDNQHMAYSGYSLDEFKMGVSEKACLEQFAEFLRKDDVICCWHSDAKNLLQAKYDDYLKTAMPCKIVCVNAGVRAVVRKKGIKPAGMYEMAETLGIDASGPRHMATNDLVVLRRLLSALEYRPIEGEPEEADSYKMDCTRRKRNADTLSRISYNYIFTSGSGIFHRPVCKLMLNAKVIQGCTYYSVAEKKRRPCKVCRPDLAERIDPVRGSQLDERQAEERNEVVLARMIGGAAIEISRKKIVGCCHNSIHPGKMNQKLLEEHDCLGKQCRFFEKYPNSTYWIAEEEKRKRKAKRKEAQRIYKEKAQKLEDELLQLRSQFQSYADEVGNVMLIIRIEKENSGRYKVFYVSENRFADGNRYPEFLQEVKRSFPHHRINLRHIRDVDGHFVTIDEYLKRMGRRNLSGRKSRAVMENRG